MQLILLHRISNSKRSLQSCWNTQIEKVRLGRVTSSEGERNLFENSTNHFLRLLLKHVGLLELEIRKQFTIYRNYIVSPRCFSYYSNLSEGKTTECTFHMGRIDWKTNLRAYEYNCRSVWCPPRSFSGEFSAN